MVLKEGLRIEECFEKKTLSAKNCVNLFPFRNDGVKFAATKCILADNPFVPFNIAMKVDN